MVTRPYMSLISWKNTEDPGSGEFSYHIDAHGFPRLVTTKGVSFFSRRAGSWNDYILMEFRGKEWLDLESPDDL